MNFGEHIRSIREQKKLLLREVASQMNMDTALLSKLERGTRSARREQVIALAVALNENETELLKIWMADRITEMLKDQKDNIEILKIVEEKIKNFKDLE
ncbi:helix-turn-helix domain-containing protein [Psychroflexus sp. ALD_RP9]|uniref:helix-turn-helix domain-containing protein n=1 Tax=Psychroflexus sp. ALD_RP9 TaxID=2777186 RepID=UPI001A8F7C17|nr:helix-turn-helix transcriptional regulator [Psychroflexus sp. ALD_RP9]QSS96335.1 helix-turn-helix transcriptional regulator [Psychroflexus sp. ALD_RP9]